MKKFAGLFIFVVLSLLARLGFPAVPATAVWEVRPTTGSNLNGGGYDSAFTGVGSSVDCTQGGTVVSFTDLTAVASTTLTSAAAQFTAAMVGNAVHLESGVAGTPGYYFITAFGSSSSVTIDRSTTITTGVGKICGATASFTGQTTTTLAASMVAGNIAYIKNEAWNEAVVLTVSGTNSLPIVIEGYNTTRGDAPTGSTRPTNARAGAGAIGFNLNAGFYIVKHLIVSGAATAGIQVAGNFNILRHVRVTGSGTKGFDLNANDVTLIHGEADLNTTQGVNLGGAREHVITSYIHNNTTEGIQAITSAESAILSSIIARNGSHGIWLTNTPNILIMNNTVDCNSSAASCGSSAVDGLNINTSTDLDLGSVITNNIFSNNGRDGIRKVTSAGTNTNVVIDYNNFYGNVGTARTNIAAGANDQALNPTYTNAAGGDYSIGANLQGLGYPGVFPGGTSTGWKDIGAVERQNLIQVGSFFHAFP